MAIFVDLIMLYHLSERDPPVKKKSQLREKASNMINSGISPPTFQLFITHIYLLYLTTVNLTISTFHSVLIQGDVHNRA